MLIHGRLFLTKHGLMLDEVRSLLQKSLRRKHRPLVLSATKELLGHAKDQLPWKSLVTFLFEDHCLSDASILRKMAACYDAKDKWKAVELLLQCYTCRVAACVPVVTMCGEYEPTIWDSETPIPEHYQGLLTVSTGQINCGRLILNLTKAWRDGSNHTLLMSYLKLVTMVEDVMGSNVTNKGEKMLIQTVKKPRPSHIFLSVLHSCTTDDYMKKYIRACFALAAIPEVCLRLILCSVITQLMFRKEVRNVDDLKLGDIKWKDVEKLDEMPSWAVDKHTFRGKFGKGTKHLVKKCPKDLSEAQYEEFHGDRPKHGIEHFFDEGCKCEKESMEVNPYWEQTKQIYYSKPHRLQKTVRMTAVYHKELLQKYPQLKVKAKPGKKRESSSDSDLEEEVTEKGASRKRTRTAVGKSNQKKLVKKDEETDEDSESEAAPKKGKKASAKSKAKTVEYSSLNLPGPLLQLPTGGGKLYTCIDVPARKVVKGPYSKQKLGMTRFFHEAMRDVLKDRHTMPIEVSGSKILFPVYMGPRGRFEVTKRDFYDAISKQNVNDGQFVMRESLGIIQLHRIAVDQIHNVPMSMWLHYVYRAALNIGDSGLYNALTDSGLSFMYGIDMEEQRRTVRTGNFLDLLFVKKPAKAFCSAILESMKVNKDDLNDIIDREVDYEKLEELAKKCAYQAFDKDLFEKRLNSAKRFVEKL